MTSHAPRAQRFAKAWLGPLLAALVGVGSTGELAALPLAPVRPQLPGAILIQQPAETSEPAREETPESFIELHQALAAARERLEELSRAAEAVAASGELQRELAALQEQNQKLHGELAAVRDERSELQAAKQAAEARAAEATGEAEQAKARAQEMDQELVAMRWQNAQLNTSLAQARTTRDQIEAEARQAQSALRQRIEELEADTEQTAALREQLDASERRVTAAGSARAEAVAQLSAARERLQQAQRELQQAERELRQRARIGDDLARVEAELATAKKQLVAAEQARAQVGQRTTALADEREQLRGQLAAVSERLERTEAVNRQLEEQVAELQAAAGSATDVARQNLVAVENRIRELNEALAAIGPAGGPLDADPALLAEPRAPAAGEQPGIQTRAWASPFKSAWAGAGENVAAATPAKQEPEPGGAGDDLEQIKTARASTSPGDGEAAMLADLPLEQRLHVQARLVDLDGKLGDQGLTTTVPGELLFVVDSDEVQESAYDILAKVAELVSVYDDRKVLIIGHTDAVGDAAYNKQLSERRAGLVKQFLVDNFEVEEQRLSTQGRGESRPIASNATLDGRRANRRVEVLILN